MPAHLALESPVVETGIQVQCLGTDPGHRGCHASKAMKIIAGTSLLASDDTVFRERNDKFARLGGNDLAEVKRTTCCKRLILGGKPDCRGNPLSVLQTLQHEFGSIVVMSAINDGDKLS